MSEASLLRALLRSNLPMAEYQQSLDFLINRHQALAEEIRTGSRVLDIGCGLKVLACFLAKENCLVCGTDIEEKNVRVARRLARILSVSEHCALQKAESSTLPFGSVTFDYVVFVWTLHDVKAEDRGPLTAESVRILRQGGRLLILDPDSQLDFDELQEMMSKHPTYTVERKALSRVYDHGAFSNAVLAVYLKEAGE